MSGVFDIAKKAYLFAIGRATPAPTTQPQPSPLRTMRGHTDTVYAVASFKDGRRIVTGSADKTLRIWDVQEGTFVGEPFKGHREAIYTVAVSSDDRRIASGGDDKSIIIWSVGSKRKVFKPLVKHTGRVRSVCFSPDDKRLASCSSDCTVIVWDVELTGAVLATFDSHRFPVFSVAFSPDGLKVASGSADRTVRVWRTLNAELLFKIDAHQEVVRSVVWSPDGQQLVSASNDRTVKFWNSSDGHQVGRTCMGHRDYIVSLAISSDGSFIATTSRDKTVRMWSTKSHQQIGQALDHAAVVWCVAISPDGELLVSGSDRRKVLIWSIENTLSTAFGLDSSYGAHRSKVNSGRKALHPEALHDADKVIELHPWSHLGYEMKHAALYSAQRYDEAIEVFNTMLSMLDDAPDPQIRQLHQKYVSQSEAGDAIRRAVHTYLENVPLRLLDTSTGRLCNREVQIKTFMESTEYTKVLYSSMVHAPLQTEPIDEAVANYFRWVMLSHRWEGKEPLLEDIQGKIVYDLDPVGTVVKLQTFLEIARDAGHLWAWSDTCCIDQNNNVELQRSVNSMFVWYRQSALTIIYLSDVPPSAKSGALANSAWNTRGWTVQEFLAPRVVLFYRADWTPYLDDRSPNHKKSANIMQELERSTGINARALIAFRPGMTGAREKLQWASMRVTTWQEDIAYSLFGIFGVHLPVIYGEKKQNALGRLLQEIIAQSGDITALDWTGKSSDFNSCLPADITSYKAPPCMLPSPPEDEMRTSVSRLRNTIAVESASELYTLLDNLGAPRFANSRLQLPCMAFPVTEVRRRRGQDRESCFTYDVKADGLQDLLITTEDRLVQFSPARPTPQTFLLVRPWNRHDLGLPDFSDDAQSVIESVPESPLDDSFYGDPGNDEPAHLDSQSRELRLLVRLKQPFGALFLAQQRGSEYKRIASDQNIMTRVKDMASIDNMMDVKTLEIL